MKKPFSILFASALMAVGCSKVPSGVIQPEKMAQLMADVHTAEAVVDMNRSYYPTDSARQAMKQSVYTRHGVSSEQVDSSFAWYGRNITYYMDVYDRTIEILEHRLIESGNRVAAEAALSIAGDSVDVWPYPRYIAVNDRLPSKTLTFNFARDPNWERGDSYTWRAKMFNNQEQSAWGIVVEYADGSMEFLSQDISDGDGWKELVFYSDSLRDATRVYGYMNAANRPGASLHLDSIEMVRKRVDPERYNRRYNVRYLRGLLPATEIKPDTTANK